MDHDLLLYNYKSNKLDREFILFNYKYRLRLFLRSYFLMKANEIHYVSHLFDGVPYILRTRPLSIIRNISTLRTRNR
jgi:hypothetical protein